MKAILIPGLALILLSTASAPVAAQSMSVPLIIETVMGEVCVPFARDGDLEGAVRAARMQGYAPMEPGDDTPKDRDPPSGRVELYRRHHGTVILGSNDREGVCGVGIHEGGAEQMGGLAAPYLRELGLEPESATRNLVVWTGEGMRLEISRSDRFRPGAELVLSFPVPPRR